MRTKPKQKRDWLVAIALVILIISEIVRTIIPSHDPLSSSTPATIDWVFRVFRDLSIITIVSTLIISGLRDIRANGMQIKRI
jgi:hypothetical protein